MRVAILGRTRILLDTAEALLVAGHQIALVGTSAEEAHYGATVDDFAGLARKASATFFEEHRINSPTVLELLQSSRCDVAVSVNWLVVLGVDAIAAFPLGVLNVHAGDLPRYRGNASPNWAILNNEPYVGLCVHQMEPGALDSGPVLARDRFPLGADTYIKDIYDWLGHRTPLLVVDALDALVRGESGTPQDPAVRPLRCHPRRPEDGRIDWSSSSSEVRRLVRASSRPFPGAFATTDDGKRVVIWRCDLHEVDYDWSAVPGQLVGRVNGDPVVVCSDGLLRITDATFDDDSDARGAIGSSMRNRLH